jgi:hypothetical protein
MAGTCQFDRGGTSLRRETTCELGGGVMRMGQNFLHISEHNLLERVRSSVHD